ncbi:MAG: UDP-N-acetylmuramate--L-alanine ligase [Candidatus Brocadiia bacterium]|nr:MAG: UDP-N-acetylmuramate--L-alanine ligase [Candidatus Brocadiia bacterium]
MGNTNMQAYDYLKAVFADGAVTTTLSAGIAGKRFHFIGAGGIGMSGLAKLLLKNDAIISGSDQEASVVTNRLFELGAKIHIGHIEANLDPFTDAVVISAAVNEDNPELASARRRGFKVYKYAQMLGELMSCYDGIAISGTHGKSTTSGWLSFCIRHTGNDASFIVGADVPQLGGSSGAGDSRIFVAEACEYDRSFLNLKHKVCCILNVEADHLDYYRDENEIIDAFRDFASGTKTGGTVIVNGDDFNSLRAVENLPNDIACETFGLGENCNFRAENIAYSGGFAEFDVVYNGRKLGRTKISVPGKHNIMNALAVVASAVCAGIDGERIVESLPGFTGIDRRLMLKAKVADITVLDDYAHHPTEIRASLEAIRGRYLPRRLWCIFQPHQYSRTRFLLDDFTESFKLADVTVVPEIYFVRDTEASMKEINAGILVERIMANGSEAVFIDGFTRICDYLKENVHSGDVIVTMGAGNIWKGADEYIQWLRTNC